MKNVSINQRIQKFKNKTAISLNSSNDKELESINDTNTEISSTNFENKEKKIDTRDTDPDLKLEFIIGARRFDNYFWAGTLFIGGLGFILTSASSYYQKPILPLLSRPDINFIPQGIVMLFYGILGLVFSFYIILTIIWDIGGGYNEFDKKTSTIRLVRRGFPGKNRNILLNYTINDIKLIEVEISEGLNPKRTLYLITNDQRRIPLTGVGQPLALAEIEEKGIALAKFLNIPYNIKR